MNLSVRTGSVPSSGGAAKVDPGDPLLRLPQPALEAVLNAFAVTSTVGLLQHSDGQILAAIRESERCGPAAANDVVIWLKAERDRCGDLVSTSLQAKASAANVISQMRQDLASAIARAIEDEGHSVQEVARRAGTSREAVASIATNVAPSSLELLLRVAAVLSIRV